MDSKRDQEIGSTNSPKIKKEPIEENVLSLERAETVEELNDEDDDDDFVIDDDGVEYYEDESFRIKQVATPLIVNRTMKDLYGASKGKYLKLDPEYQRDVVWDETRSSALVASIMQGYFIPPIIFNLVTVMEHEKGNPNKVMKFYRICVDGKQRLSSLIKFMDGRIGVWDSMHPPKKWYFTHPIVNGVEQPSAHLILPEKTKNFFRLRTFCCYEYNNLPESVEENMFQLVQRGMPLTPAERMRALSTMWAVFAKQYEEDYAMVVNLSKQARASGFRAVVTIFSQICEVMNPSGNRRTNRDGNGQTPTLQASPQVLTQLLLDDQAPSEGVKAKFKEVFDKFQKLVDLSIQKSHSSKFGYKIIANSAFDPAPDYLRERSIGHVKTFSPLELLATAILILIHRESRTTGMLIGDIKEMRIYLRKEHKDLRLNPACWVTVWKFIEEDLVRLRGGRGVVRNHWVEVNGTGIENNEGEETEYPFDSAPATPVQGFCASASETLTNQPTAERIGASKAAAQLATPGRGSSSAKNIHELNKGPRKGLVDDHRSATAHSSPGSKAIVGSKATAFIPYAPDPVLEATGTPKSGSVQILTSSDDSDDGRVFSANKKRKKF